MHEVLLCSLQISLLSCFACLLISLSLPSTLRTQSLILLNFQNSFRRFHLHLSLRFKVICMVPPSVSCWVQSPDRSQLSVPSTVPCRAGIRAVLEVMQSVPITSSGCPSRSGSLSSFVFGVSAPTSVDSAWWPVAHFISLVSALRAVSQARDLTKRKGGWGWHSGDQLPAFLRKFPIS